MDVTSAVNYNSKFIYYFIIFIYCSTSGSSTIFYNGVFRSVQTLLYSRESIGRSRISIKSAGEDIFFQRIRMLMVFYTKYPVYWIRRSLWRKTWLNIQIHAQRSVHWSPLPQTGKRKLDQWSLCTRHRVLYIQHYFFTYQLILCFLFQTDRCSKWQRNVFF